MSLVNLLWLVRCSAGSWPTPASSRYGPSPPHSSAPMNGCSQ